MKQKIFLSSLIVIFLIAIFSGIPKQNLLAREEGSLCSDYNGKCKDARLCENEGGTSITGTECDNTLNGWGVCCVPKSTNSITGSAKGTVGVGQGQNVSLTIPNPLGETSDIYTLIEIITKFLIGLAIVITPIIIVYAGFLYITAAGNEEKVKTAQKVLIWALIGFALVLIARGVPALIKQFLTGSSNGGDSKICADSGGNCCSTSEVCSGQILGPCDNGLICCEGECTTQ